ncbi:MAG: hypothetical protein GF404_08965 [candidate division Zixibacteria bacterium]|nr:hypothetical protein [candidate division Zixibacteria bacterium]
MSKYQPPGRLSKVTGPDFMIQIQTEFAWSPHARITTSVILDGVLIHKIQKEWDSPLETDDEKQAVSKLINKQHNEVEKIIRTNQDFILDYGKPKKKETDFEAVLKIDGVSRAFLLSGDGILTPFTDEEIEIEKVHLFENLFELVEFLDLTTSLGGMQEGFLVLDDDRIMIFKYKESYLIVVLTQSASSKDTARRVIDFIKAA